VRSPGASVRVGSREVSAPTRLSTRARLYSVSVPLLWISAV